MKSVRYNLPKDDGLRRDPIYGFPKEFKLACENPTVYYKKGGRPGIRNCRKCIPCARRERGAWVERAQKDAESSMNAGFESTMLTFTFSEAGFVERGHCEPDKAEFQAAIKRIQKETRSLFGHTVRYVAASENGERKGRLHYHCVAIGLSFGEAMSIKKKVWTLGDLRVDAFDATKHCAYVLKYALSGLGHTEHFFAKTPGLGRDYAKYWAQRADVRAHVLVNGDVPGIGEKRTKRHNKWVHIKVAIPPYYRQKAREYYGLENRILSAEGVMLKNWRGEEMERAAKLIKSGADARAVVVDEEKVALAKHREKTPMARWSSSEENSPFRRIGGSSLF